MIGFVRDPEGNHKLMDESGQVFAGGGIIWTIVGVLAVIALLIWISPHFN